MIKSRNPSRYYGWILRSKKHKQGFTDWLIDNGFDVIDSSNLIRGEVIAFNGKESARLFAKHFGSLKGIKLLALPSTSPANASISWNIKVSEWSKLRADL